MLDLMLFGGVVVALAGVVQVASRRQSRWASSVSLLREGIAGMKGADAEALRAEFRRSGITMPDPRRGTWF
jgi:hypothetical protein